MNAQRLIALATLVIAGAFAMNDIRVGVFLLTSLMVLGLIGFIHAG